MELYVNVSKITELYEKALKGDNKAQFEYAMCLRKINIKIAYLEVESFLGSKFNDSMVINEEAVTYEFTDLSDPSIYKGTEVAILQEEILKDLHPSNIFALLSKSSESGNNLAYFYTGLCYYEGFGVEKNIATAHNIFRKCLQFDIGGAYFMIGCMFRGGEIENKDIRIAHNYYLESAKRGYSEAMDTLGYDYEEGWCAILDLVKALAWFLVGKAYGNLKCSNEITELCNKLSLDDTNKSKHLAEQFIKNPKDNPLLDFFEIDQDVAEVNELQKGIRRHLIFSLSKIPHCNIELISSITRIDDKGNQRFTEHKKIFSKTALRVPINLAEAVKRHCKGETIFLQSLRRTKGKKAEYVNKMNPDQCRQIKKEINDAMKELLDIGDDFIIQPDTKKQEYQINTKVFEVTLA